MLFGTAILKDDFKLQHQYDDPEPSELDLDRMMATHAMERQNARSDIGYYDN